MIKGGTFVAYTENVALGLLYCSRKLGQYWKPRAIFSCDALPNSQYLFITIKIWIFGPSTDLRYGRSICSEIRKFVCWDLKTKMTADDSSIKKMDFDEFCSDDSIITCEEYALEAETIKFIASQQSEATIKSNSVSLNRVTAFFCRERWISINIPSQRLSELLALFSWI